MANIQFKILDENELILELLEDAKKGDLINLKSVLEEKQKFISNFDSKIKEKYEKRIKNEVEKEISIQTIKIEKDTINNFKVSDEYVDLSEQKKELEETVKSFEKIKKLEIKNETNQLKTQLSKTIQEMKQAKEMQVVKLTNEIEQLKTEKRTSEELISQSNKIDKNALIERHQEIILEKNNHIERLNKEKKILNIKQKGEELEQFILREFENLAWDDNIEFYKTNKSIHGKKPDFFFSIKDHEGQLLVSIILEAKTEFDTSINKTKNSEHFKVLEINRKNFKADYAILISELEMDDFFLIKKINQPEYKNLYVIRPDFFTSFLSLVRIFALKDVELKSKQINFQDRLKILNDFTEFKEAIMDKHLDNINKNIIKMKNSAEAISKQSNKILESADVILNTHLKRIISAIEKYDIQKKVITQLDNI